MKAKSGESRFLLDELLKEPVESRPPMASAYHTGMRMITLIIDRAQVPRVECGDLVGYYIDWQYVAQIKEYFERALKAHQDAERQAGKDYPDPEPKPETKPN